MFTGIIEMVARVTGAEEGPDRRRLWLDLGGLPHFDLRNGDSVAVDGACLTAAALDGTRAAFDCVTETLDRTTVGRLRPGMEANVERALRPTDRLGGQFVQGHVDGVGTVVALRAEAGQTLLMVRAPDLAAEMVPKGSVAVDGVSLTIAALTAEGFTAALVPFTLAHTTLGRRRPGDAVDLETDLVGKYIRAYLSRIVGSRGLSADFLREHGFA